MPVGISGVGDIIAICLLAKDLNEALRCTRGAEAEYQAINQELWILERALLQIEMLSQTCSDCDELKALVLTAQHTTEKCRVSMGTFLNKIRKYAPSLRDGGSGNFVVDASRKVQWQVMQSSDVQKFRAEIVAYSQSLNMLLATASVSRLAIQEKRLADRLAQTEQNIKDEMSQQSNMIVEVRDRLNENTALLTSVTTKVAELARLDWLAGLGANFRDMMVKIFNTNMATYKAVVEIQSVLPSQLERSLFHEPFVLEDAIGRIAPVHTQFINSWEAFDHVLELRFRELEGYQKILKKEYTFQERATGREITRSRRWESAFLPGQKIDMSMIFERVSQANGGGSSKDQKSSCPNCFTISDAPNLGQIQCVACGISFQRITEFLDAPTLTTGGSTQDASTRRATAASADEDIHYFKRIRLIEFQNRLDSIPQPMGRVQAILHSWQASEAPGMRLAVGAASMVDPASPYSRRRTSVLDLAYASERRYGVGAVGAAAGVQYAGGIVDLEMMAAAKEALNADSARLKMEKAGQDNALQLI